MRDALIVMYEWCKNNQITLNSKQCEYVHFNYRKLINQDITLKLGDVTLNKMRQDKYLGTVIDEKLNGAA